MNKILFIIPAFFVILSSCYNDNEEELYPNITPCQTTNVTYNAGINSILSNSCVNCHGASTANGNIRLDSYTSAKTNIDIIISAINPTTGTMPKDQAKLNACKIQSFNVWKTNNTPEN